MRLERFVRRVVRLEKEWRSATKSVGINAPQQLDIEPFQTPRLFQGLAKMNSRKKLGGDFPGEAN
jgi:hypothetical protein